jgi:hypothetical protein
MPAIRQSGSMSGMWKRSHRRTSEAPPDERAGYRYVRPTATASHLDATQPCHLGGPAEGPESTTHCRHSLASAAMPAHAPTRTFELREKWPEYRLVVWLFKSPVSNSGKLQPQ